MNTESALAIVPRAPASCASRPPRSQSACAAASSSLPLPRPNTHPNVQMRHSASSTRDGRSASCSASPRAVSGRSTKRHRCAMSAFTPASTPADRAYRAQYVCAESSGGGAALSGSSRAQSPQLRMNSHAAGDVARTARSVRASSSLLNRR